MFAYFVFLLALNFVFSKTKMFKLLFILFVIKQLLGNLTSDIDIYTAKQSVVRLGKADCIYCICVYLSLRAKKIVVRKFLKISSL